MKRLLIFAVFAFLLASCAKQDASPSASGQAKRYPLKGKVVSVDRAAKKARVEHAPIPDLMPAMTMDFPIAADWVWDELRPGVEIQAELLVDNTANEPFWLENIGIVASARDGQPAPTLNEKFAQIGTPVPDFRLTDHNGKAISLKDFRGKTLALTFIYARCPLAEYCIRMSTHFSDLANELKNDPEASKLYALLSISFDPENDTPDKLRAYGLGYMGQGATDLGVWRLAVGTDAEVRKIADYFGLFYEVDAADKTQINHSLRTAVISPDGKTTKIFAGNEWTPSELLAEMKAARGE